ncbi:MAG: hypothetical protein IJ412_05030 [Oscillospiraceae bacterium]|nr:hypothetical protein [Oscillospiraceae bacterium]
MELKKQLLEQYPFRVELHAHCSPASPCGDLPAREVVRIFHDAGYDALALTNHFFPLLSQQILGEMDKEKYLAMYFDCWHEACDEAAKLGMTVWLGAELRWSAHGCSDYLIYGVDEAMLRDIYDYLDADAAAFVRDCKSEKSFFVQAHPMRDGCTPLDAVLLDGVEVFNMHPNHNSRVALAAKQYAGTGLPVTMGTDYHHPGHHGLCATRMASLPKDSFELAALLKSGDYIMQLGESIVLP